MLVDRLRNISNCLPAGVQLLAVSKGQPVSSIRALADLGQCHFGESRIQEALPKINTLKSRKRLRWHFIGRLQSNKVRSVVRSFEFIHSVDSLVLAERINRISGEENRLPKAMVQVKFREDPTKGGYLPEQLLDEWARLLELPHLKLVGLMTMPPIGLGMEERGILFKECRVLADKLNLQDCSMGMSSDWKEALQAGATWLRLGSTLFGDRSKYFNNHTDITKSN